MANITENLQTIYDCRIDIKQAIIDKGGEVGDLTTYAGAIANLPSEEETTINYNIDFNQTTENNKSIYEFLNRLLSSITCNNNEVNSIKLERGLTAIRVTCPNVSGYDIHLNSDGTCRSAHSGGSDD